MNGYGKRVLIAEEDEDQQNLLGVVLESERYSVHVACNGRQALDEMKRRRFDAVVIGHHMPQINGFQLILLGRLVWPETPMILLSGDDANLSQMAEQGGAYGCLREPYDASTLLKLIGTAIETAGGRRLHTLGSASLALG